MKRGRALLMALSIIIAATALSLSGSAKQARYKEHSAQQSEVVFVVLGSAAEGLAARMEPILLLEGGKFKAPVAGDSDINEINRFSNEHYGKGKSYRLLFGGAEAGTATVKKSDSDEECFRTGADITIQTDVKLNSNVMALATDSKTLGLAASQRSRRAPAGNERTQVLELARAAYKQKGIAASLLSSLQVINLTAIDLDHDGKAEIAGSFVVSKRTRGQERYTLFLLALPQGAGFRTAFSNFDKHTEKDVMSGASINVINEGIYVERLVDHLDLDGDRISELITTATGLEGVSYYIYKRQNGEWSKAYEFGNYRCAF